MKTPLTLALALGLLAQSNNLKIVVIAGEGGVNIIQQKTAVAPVIEVRDRNNLPVAGASVTFSVAGGSGASFGGGASALTVATNAAGQATAAGLTPTAAGALHINVAAAFQGQTVTAAITQTNVMTAAQAAAAAGGGAAGGGGLGIGTIAIIGGAVAGGAVAAVQTGVIGGEKAYVTIRGEVYTTIRFGGNCTTSAGVDAPRECYGDLVVGGIVSTSLDSKTATTGSDGRFELVTATLEDDAKCRDYTLTITAAGQPTYSIPVKGFASNGGPIQKFAMSPPTPFAMNGGC